MLEILSGGIYFVKRTKNGSITVTLWSSEKPFLQEQLSSRGRGSRRNQHVEGILARFEKQSEILILFSNVIMPQG